MSILNNKNIYIIHEHRFIILKLCRYDMFLFSDVCTPYQCLQYFYFIRRDSFVSYNYVLKLLQNLNYFSNTASCIGNLATSFFFPGIRYDYNNIVVWEFFALKFITAVRLKYIKYLLLTLNLFFNGYLDPLQPPFYNDTTGNQLFRGYNPDRFTT